MEVINQYEIVLVDLNPTKGSEINKTRPCVVISPNEMNEYLNTLIVAPMTTSSKSYPTRIKVKFNNTLGWIVIDQIRTIDKNRVIKKYEKLSSKEILRVKQIIKEAFVD